MLQVACWLCRRRKTRCDGGRPQCANCLEKRESCVYETQAGESRGMAMRRENGVLQSRVNQLEAEAEASKSSSGSADSGTLSGGSNLDFFEQQSASDVASGHTFTRARDLFHAMATTSDQDASMILAKLRSGYSWEQLAGETEAATAYPSEGGPRTNGREGHNENQREFEHHHHEFEQSLDPALQNRGS
ncbi:hypothetical protein BST61_g8529 [Cercospora zeina]